jgi:hypothetical protein
VEILRKTTEHLSQDNRYPGRGSDRGIRSVAAAPTRSVISCPTFWSKETLPCALSLCGTVTVSIKNVRHCRKKKMATEMAAQAAIQTKTRCLWGDWKLPPFYSLVAPADMKETVTVYQSALNLLTSFCKSRVSTPVPPHPRSCSKPISPETSPNTWLYVQSVAKVPTLRFLWQKLWRMQASGIWRDSGW